MYSDGAWHSLTSTLYPELIHQFFTSLAGVEPGLYGETRRHWEGDREPSLPPAHGTMTPRPTGPPAVRPRRLGSPGPYRCRRGTGAAPRGPLSFLYVPQEAVTDLRRWDSPAFRLRLHWQRPASCLLFASAQLLCVDNTRRSPHRGGRHGVSRASGEDAPGAAAIPPGSRWSEPLTNVWETECGLGHPLVVGRSSEPGHNPGWKRLSEAPPRNKLSISGSWERSLDPRAGNPDQATRRMAPGSTAGVRAEAVRLRPC